MTHLDTSCSLTLGVHQIGSTPVDLFVFPFRAGVAQDFDADFPARPACADGRAQATARQARRGPLAAVVLAHPVVRVPGGVAAKAEPEVQIGGGRRGSGSGRPSHPPSRRTLRRCPPGERKSRRCPSAVPEVHGPLIALRLLRNRIAHHEPVIKRDLSEDHDLVLELAGWMSPAMRSWIEYHSRVPTLLARAEKADLRYF